MAVYIHCNFNSEVLRMATDVNILIPDNDRVRQFREKTNVPVKYQTLYLLHGFSCDYTYYLRKTNIERYADEHQIMVVMPSMYNSAYTDMKYGLEYYTYLSEELLDFVERTFPASAEKENRFVAGMSMVMAPTNSDYHVRKNSQRWPALQALTMPNIDIREKSVPYRLYVRHYMEIRRKLLRKYMTYLRCWKDCRNRVRKSLVYIFAAEQKMACIEIPRI